MRTGGASEGKSLLLIYLSSVLLLNDSLAIATRTRLADIYLGRTMVWAIDLDDGTLINALGSNMGRPKTKVYPEPPYYVPDFGTPWDVEEEL